MRKQFYGMACALLFIAGAYVWKVKRSGLEDILPSAEKPRQIMESGIMVEVGPERVTQADVDWEYDALVSAATDPKALTPVPDLGERLGKELEPLRRSLLSNIIERKLLFVYLQQDRAFSYDDPARYTSCLAAWQAALARGPKPSSESSRMLKAKLCEQSLFEQYWDERLGSEVTVTEAEVTAYFAAHADEFLYPDRVLIRQVVLSNEAMARKIRGQINVQNFAALAREYSITPEAASGGQLGPFTQKAMPAVFEIAFHMKEHAISEVVKSDYGYHIITVVKSLPHRRLTLAEARPAVTERLKKAKQEDAYKRLVDRALTSVVVQTPKQLW